MPTDLTKTDEIVLLGVLADSLALEEELKANPKKYRHDWDPAMNYAYGNGVRINHCGWAGLPYADPTISKRLQRSILKLAKANLLERIAAPWFGYSDPPRVTHVKLTATGRKLAQELRKPQMVSAC